MKTLKKILSVVLVVAMLASMCIVGAAAAETEKTNYEEAVAVVTGVGIIEGDENGMNYTGNVTREQAAKIIAYLLLGKDTAEALKTSAAPFADVAATRWSAGYIAYLKGQGIISGVSDTEFDPTANVTGIAFAKMLLTAVGYGANGEFEGKDWDINTITFANDNGVFAGTKAADVAAPATREEAMLYAFNVLTGVPVVKYNKTFESYYSGKSALDPVTGNVYPWNTGADDPYAYTLAWTKYDMYQDYYDAFDDFGRPAATWIADGKKVAETVANIEPDAVLTGTVYSSNLYTALGKSIIKDLNESIDPVYKTNDAIQLVEDGIWEYDHVYSDPFKAGELTNGIGGDGATTEVYVFEPTTGRDYYVVRLVTYYEYLGEVSKITSDNKMTIDALAGGKKTVDGEDFDLTGYAKEDMVLYTMAAGEIMSITPVDYTVGTFTGFDFMGQALIDGVAKKVSAKDYDNINIANPDFTTTWNIEIGTAYKFYADSQGNLLMAEPYDEAGVTNTYNFLYVAGAQVQAETADPNEIIDAKKATVALNVVYPDGGKEVLNYAVKYNKTGDYYYITVNKVDYKIVGANQLVKVSDDSAVAIDTVFTGWMTYTLNDAGAVTLKDAAPEYATETTTFNLAAGKADFAPGKLANSKTVLKVVNAQGAVKAYTGVANFPAVAITSGEAIYTYAYGSDVAKTIYVFGTVSGDADLAYCAMKWSEDINGFTYMFYVDGAAQFILFEDSLAISAFDAGTGYVYELSEDDGVYSAARLTADTMVYTGTPGAVDVPFDIPGVGTIPANSSAVKGTVNSGIFQAMDMKTYAFKYAEFATIDTVDDNYFTTVEVETDEFDDSEVGKHFANTAGQYAAGKYVPSYTYYFDGNTKIYDCTQTPDGTLDSGDVFVAYVDMTATNTYSNNYCTIIWIVA